MEEMKQQAIILQYFGIGDIIYSQTIAHKIKDEGYKIIWPVEPDFLEGLRTAYPEFEWVDRTLYVNINYNLQEDCIHGGSRIIPLRWANEMLKVPFKDCMKAKYDLYKMPWENWADRATYLRDHAKEQALFDMLDLDENEPYTLCNSWYKSNSSGQVKILLSDGLKRVNMQRIEGFSLFDWSLVIERASNIHTVSTSIIYILELLQLQAKNICIYIRRPQESSHKNYDYLLRSHNYTLMP